jgi:hypothetical protein
VFASESEAGSFIRARIAKGTAVHADESGAWDGLHERFEMKRSTIKRRTASMVPAPIKRRNVSAACAVPRSAFIAGPELQPKTLMAVVLRGSGPN